MISALIQGGNMPTFTMESRWGVQLEGSEYDLRNVANKLNGSISSPSSFFVSTINDEVYVLRSRDWDKAVTPPDAYQLALGDIRLIRGCLDVLDGCEAIELGTVYEFNERGGFDMSRQTSGIILVKKKTEDLASPKEFHQLLMRARSHDALREAFADLTPSASWVDIYRCWESLKDYYGGEHKVHLAFKAEKKKIKRMSQTANSFRHVKSYAPVADPMTRDEAIAYMKDLLQRTAATLGLSSVSSAFAPKQKVEWKNYHLEPGRPAALKRLALGPPRGDRER
jgi:hypothetical protein